jgi:hypothetical protein
LAALAVVVLAGLSPLAAAPVISRGVDTFTTIANGKTFYDFAQNPIPAGFFCKRSAAFTGRVTLRGVPLATEVPGELHGADTVIERLDDAAFDDQGVAVTRLRFKALSLASIAPIRTACGAFHVFVKLADRQRETTMKIYRTSEQGGNFVAPLAVDARMTFIPVRSAKRAAGRPLELVGSFTFPAQPLPWMHQAGAQTKRLASARIDTDGDQAPDAVVVGTSNFHPGWTPEALVPLKVGGGCRRVCEPEECHTDPATLKEHCSGPLTTCCTCACP